MAKQGLIMKIKVESWSHCCGEWQFYSNFRNKVDFNNHISECGYDPKYFRINPPSEDKRQTILNNCCGIKTNELYYY